LRSRSVSPAKLARTASQLLFLGLITWVAWQMWTGVRGATIEKYCPFGGVETILPWLRKTGTLCSLSTLNLSMMAGVLVMTVVLKRAFCSHVCPIGTISEWVSRLGRRLHLRVDVPRKVDRPLRYVKYLGLIAIIVFTYRVQELIFREVDPFFVLFTLGRGHGIAEGVIGIGQASLWIVIGLLAAGLVVPMLFCRYLCPFAAFLTPFSRLGAARVRRNETHCTSCGKCDRACDWGLLVSQKPSVTNGECSNCQACVQACPVPGALSFGFRAPGAASPAAESERIEKVESPLPARPSARPALFSLLFPPIVAGLFFAAIFAGQAWELPTMQHTFDQAGSASQSERVEMIVEGLRCRGTSAFLVQRLQAVPGVLGVETYVQEHRATISYDPAKLTVEAIRGKIDEPVLLNDGRQVQAFHVTEIKD